MTQQNAAPILIRIHDLASGRAACQVMGDVALRDEAAQNRPLPLPSPLPSPPSSAPDDRMMPTGHGVPVNLISSEYCGAVMGAAWFARLIGQLRDEFPSCAIHAIFDCRGRVSAALAAIELGYDAQCPAPATSTPMPAPTTAPIPAAPLPPINTILIDAPPATDSTARDDDAPVMRDAALRDMAQQGGIAVMEMDDLAAYRMIALPDDGRNMDAMARHLRARLAE